MATDVVTDEVLLCSPGSTCAIVPSLNETLSKPEAATFDQGNNSVIIADTGNNVIRRADATSGSFFLFSSLFPTQVNSQVNNLGNLMGTYGSPGSSVGQFSNPNKVFVNSFNHDVIVADSGNNRIQVLTSNGLPSPLL